MATAAQVPRHTNRLIRETSPYLLQHAHNPVDWYAWGDEALARAKAENKPILLSIGYSACHWCHVMERESFENESVAALMNRHFVNIKVDREERPDLDDIYMAATLALNAGQGGWPMTVFLTPDQRPFFAGTYFPPSDRFGRPGFSTLLTQIAGIWERRRDDLLTQAEALTIHLREQSVANPGGNLSDEQIRAAARELAAAFDPTYGGFGRAPKFPPATQLGLLLRHHRRAGDAAALAMATKTLDCMAQGGMYDQIGGGFARYSTDDRWLVPHFEKMLYDNALLTKAYLEGYQATGDLFYGRIAREILDYVGREMTDPAGGFYSATDADSEGEEGKFFVWTPAEVEAVLGGDEGGRLCAYYDITEEGNWEGKSIPHTPRSVERVASRLGIPAESLRASVDAGRAALYEVRRRRTPPGLDDKILTAWNGMMVGAMAEGSRVLGEPRYLATAVRAADFLLATLRRRDGRLLRTYRNGRAHLDAYLEDYAFLAEGLVDLYEAGGDAHYLREAVRLAERILADFADADGGFYDTAHDHEELIVRHKDGADGAIPSANAVTASVLARLSAHVARPDFRERAVAAIHAYGRLADQHPRAFCRSLCVVDFLLEGPVELAFVGAPGDANVDALRAAVGRRYLPNRIIAHHDPATGTADLPLLAGKGLVEGRPALYVCRDFACQAPVTDPADLDRALAEGARGRDGGARTSIAARRPGRATSEGTAARAARLAAQGLAHGYGRLGATGLTASRIGFGCYRVDDETPTHREALTKAILGGVSLIDTSTNYMDGASERLVGSVLASLEREGRVSRSEVVVVSKIGYVQGRNLALAREREAVGRPFPEMVKYADGCWHCVHPEFLADQLHRSLERLQLEALDVCLLHNPEYFFSDAKQRRVGRLDELREQFYRRLTEAFAWLEGEVAAGRIAWYGVSSNTAVNAPDDFEATSLPRMLEAARVAGGQGHHFRVLQVPMNLFESSAGEASGTGVRVAGGVVDLAVAEGVAVLTNRPLNAFVEEQLIRLADVPLDGVADAPSLDDVLPRLAALEEEFRLQIGAHLRTPEGGPAPEDWFRWAEQLRAIGGHVRSLDHWRQIEEDMILPAVSQVAQVLDRSLSGSLGDRWRSWRSQYLPTLDLLLQAFRLRAARHSQAVSNRVAAALNPHLPVGRRGASLSRKALWVLVSTSGVSTVLLGMRHPDYVSDALEVLTWSPLGDPRRAYEAMREVRAG